MNKIKKFTGALVLSIGLVLSGVALAQNPTQSGEKKEGESCCAMATCCCKGDSCSMKEHAEKDHAKEHADKDKRHKEHSDKDVGCCGKGDSCQMKMKEKKNS